MANFGSPVISSERGTRTAAVMHRYLQRRHVVAIVLLTIIPGILGACTSGWGRAQPKAEELPRLVWPEPPDPARIELVSVFAQATDLGIKRSLWMRLASFVSGAGDTHMVRPSGVAASGTHICVADPGAGLVHLYDLSQHRSLALTACGEMALAEPVAVAFLADRIYVSDAALARIA